MKTIEINGKEYQIEFSFEAAERGNIANDMFLLSSGAMIARHTNGMENDADAMKAIIDGSADMVGMIPGTTKKAFRAGLMEHHPEIKEDDAKQLLRDYMKESKLSYRGVYNILAECMEEDGFFDLSGLTDLLKEMNLASEVKAEEIKSSGNVTEIKKGQKKQTSKKSSETTE